MTKRKSTVRYKRLRATRPVRACLLVACSGTNGGLAFAGGVTSATSILHGQHAATATVAPAKLKRKSDRVASPKPAALRARNDLPHIPKHVRDEVVGLFDGQHHGLSGL